MDQLDIMLSKLLTTLKEKSYSPLEEVQILKTIGQKDQSMKVAIIEKAIRIATEEPKEKAMEKILAL